MGSVTFSPATSEAERDLIRRELQENGRKVETNEFGMHLENLIGFEFAISTKVAMGTFIVSEKSCQPHGVLHGGVTAFIAESIASWACGYSSKGERVAGVDLNVNHLRAVPIGTEVTVIAKALSQGSKLDVWEVKFEILNPKKAIDSTTSKDLDTILSAVARVTLIRLAPRVDSANIASKTYISKRV